MAVARDQGEMPRYLAVWVEGTGRGNMGSGGVFIYFCPLVLVQVLAAC